MFASAQQYWDDSARLQNLVRLEKPTRRRARPLVTVKNFPPPSIDFDAMDIPRPLEPRRFEANNEADIEGRANRLAFDGELRVA